MTWELIIYCFPVTFTESLQTTGNRFFKNGQDWQDVQTLALYRERTTNEGTDKTSEVHAISEVPHFEVLESVNEETNYVHGYML